MANILITSGGRRVSLVRAFKKELSKIYPQGKVFVADSVPDLSAASQIADKSVRINFVDDIGYIDSLISICMEHDVKVIIPTIDSELLILSKNKTKLLELGITMALSDNHFVEVCQDKIKTQEFFKKSNIQVAKVYGKTDYRLPIYIKPIGGSNSVNNYIIRTEDEISNHFRKNDDLLFFEYLDHNLYDEFTCDLYYDKTCGLKCIVPRKRIEIRGGEVSKGVTKRNELYKFIHSTLSYIEGARGCITIQFFVSKSSETIIKGIEINARFGGGFPLSYLAGANYPKWIIQEYIMNESIDFFDSWEENLLMLRYDDEVLVRNYED